jgi:hypothetical protein
VWDWTCARPKLRKPCAGSGGPAMPGHVLTTPAPLGLRLCAAKPELQARARPPGGRGGSLAGLRAQRPCGAHAHKHPRDRLRD